MEETSKTKISFSKDKNIRKLFKRKILRKFLVEQSDFISNLLTECHVPNRVEDDDTELYLLPSKEKIKKMPTIEDFKKINNLNGKEQEEIDDRLNRIKNKMKVPKSNINKSEKARKRKEMKKLKKNKEIKKLLVSAHKAEKNENVKGGKGNHPNGLSNGFKENDKKDIKLKQANDTTLFNEKGKLLYSKIDFAAYPGSKTKKSKKEKCMKNPKDILKKIKEQDKKIHELKEQGEEEKAQELKKEIQWKKAFDKIQGKKVKDDKNLLYKSIKKKKNIKKKSKDTWKGRKAKVKEGIESRQKKRQENIQKRISDKRNKKLKKLTKKGHIVKA